MRGTAYQFFLFALVLPSLSPLWARPAAAKVHNPSIMGHLGYRTQHALVVAAELQWALTETWAIKARGGPELLNGPVQGSVMVGPSARLDVATWVPAVFVLGGIALAPARPGLQLGAEISRYLSLHTAAVATVAAQWRGSHHFQGVVMVGISHQL